jgi:hypothetical protein
VTGAKAFSLMPDHYRKPIEELAAQPGLPWELQMMLTAGGAISRQRCRFATDFMDKAASPDDIMLMVDFDIAPTGQNYVDLLCRMASGVDVCGGLYTTRDRSGHWVVNVLPGEQPSPSGLLRVIEIGTGFKAFRRSVFDRVLLRNPWLSCVDETNPSRLCGFFSMGPVRDEKVWPGFSRWLTEDFWFDWLCRDAGITIAADTRIRLKHRDEDTGELYPAQFPGEPGALPPEIREL